MSATPSSTRPSRRAASIEATTSAPTSRNRASASCPSRAVEVVVPAGDVVEQVRRQGQPRRVELARVGRQACGRTRARVAEHHEADPDPAVDGPDQARLHHLREALDDVAEVGRDRLDRLQGERLPEDDEPPAQPLRVVVEPVVAPRDRRGEGALTLGHVGGGGAQQLQAGLQAGAQAGEPEQAYPRCGQLEGERDAVEQPAHLGQLGLLAGELEVRVRLTGDPEEQLRGRARLDLRRRRADRRHCQRRNGHGLLRATAAEGPGRSRATRVQGPRRGAASRRPLRRDTPPRCPGRRAGARRPARPSHRGRARPPARRRWPPGRRPSRARSPRGSSTSRSLVSRSRAAATMATRVLPEPPRPVRVTSRLSGSWRVRTSRVDQLVPSERRGAGHRQLSDRAGHRLVARGRGSRAGSSRRIAASRRCSASPGSMPSSLARLARASAYTSSASSDRWSRCSAVISWPHSRSRVGCSRTASRSSSTASACRPERQRQLEAVLDGSEPLLDEPLRHLARERHVLDPGQRRPAPERQGALERAQRDLGLLVAGLGDRADRTPGRRRRRPRCRDAGLPGRSRAPVRCSRPGPARPVRSARRHGRAGPGLPTARPPPSPRRRARPGLSASIATSARSRLPAGVRGEPSTRTWTGPSSSTRTSLRLGRQLAVRRRLDFSPGSRPGPPAARRRCRRSRHGGTPPGRATNT